MFLKIHGSEVNRIVALCDAEFLGRVLAEGKIRLDLEKYADFYRGEKVDAAKAVAALRETKNANIVGARSLAAAKEAGFDVSGAIIISGVPHLQAYGII